MLSRKRDKFAYNRPPADEPWVWFTVAMLCSPAWASMPLAARKVVERIVVEHWNHGGVMNGELVVTYNDFVQFGIRRSSILEAIQIAKALGFIDVVVQGRRAYGVHRTASQYGLTWLGRRDRTPPSNRWRNFDEATAAAEVARLQQKEWRPKRGPSRNADIEGSHAGETGTAPPISTVASLENATGISRKSGTGKSPNSGTGRKISAAEVGANDADLNGSSSTIRSTARRR